MQITAIIRLLVFTLTTCFAVCSMAAITVDSVVVKNSNCANDGVITLHAHSPSTMLYAIIAGPDLRPPQSGTQFAGLPAGSYQLRITNFSNDTALASAVVEGNYSFPDFTPTYIEPFCPNTATGTIIGNANLGGTAPFTWHLLDLATNTTTVQTSDTFFNLHAGSYSIRQYDSCQNFATRSLTLTDPVHDFTIGNINNRLFACDSVELYIELYVDGGNYALPYTIQIQTANGTYQHIVTQFYSGGFYPQILERVGGVTYGDYCNFTITDACGNSQSRSNLINPFTPTPNYSMITDSCQSKAGAYFSLNNVNNLLNVWPTAMNGPVKIIIYNPVTGAAIDSTVTGNQDTSVYVAFSSYVSPGQSYNIKLTDGCGNVYTNTIVMPLVPPAQFQYFFTNNSCFDSTNSYGLQWLNYFSSLPTFELLSGPANIKSTKPHYAYADTIIYPQIHPVGAGGNNGNGDYAHYVELLNLGVGTYHYHIYDSCGKSITDSFTVRPQDVADLTYSLGYIKGCPGQNKITMKRSTNLNDYAFFTVTDINGQQITPPVFYSLEDTAINLNAGRYIVTVNYYRSGSYLSVNASLYCNTVVDTITIPAYDLPKIDYAVQIKCNGTVNVGLLPDSTKGIAPYTYEIISGPQTVGVQPDNFFTLTQPGNYSARISDVCGFARTFTFSVDTLSFHQIVKVGSSCIGNSVTLIAEHSPYATYTWTKPNATQYTGDTLRISPVTTTDYGVYDIMKVVAVNNCRDTFYATYTLNSSSMSYLYDTICAGDSVIFAGVFYKQSGTYYDTIAAAPCDSIVALHLNVQASPYDSLVRSICTGQSIVVGTHTYSTTGMYRDTLNTANGCDSIVVLNLTVDGYKRDSLVRTICFGQSVVVGSNNYSTTGIYRDTLSTATCDSIHILNLTVEQQKRDSVTLSLCAGESVTVGAHTYNATGVYTDTISTSTCDSIHVLNLTVADYKRDSISVVLCAGDSLNIQGKVYTISGVHYDTLGTATCDSIFVLNVQVLPVMQQSVSQSICRGDSIAVGGIYYSSTGVYIDTLTSSAGCDSVLILNLLVTDIKHDTIEANVCAGESIIVEGTAYTQAGVYNDTFTTTTCDSVRTVIIYMHEKPVIQLSPTDTVVMAGEAYELIIQSDSIYSYTWYTPIGVSLTQTSAATALATAYNSGWVLLQASNRHGCVVSDSVFVEVNYCHESVFVPNAFSPNGDGNNDEFRIYGRCIALEQVQVFNRWGEKVWETPDIEKGWNGYYKGQLQLPGVYVYVVTYFSTAKQEGEAQLLKGSLTLIR